MKYILKSLKEIFITYIINFLIIIISGLIYNLLGYNNLEYFINSILPIILIIFYILTIIYLYKRNYIKEKSLSKKEYFPLSILGISIATILNMIIFRLFPPTSTTSLPIIISIISTGIIGPIYEEILFRYILYNRLKKKYSIKKSCFLTTSIFALIHLSPIKIIYAFLLGLTMNILYERHRSILAHILIHVCANTIVILLYEYNTYILLLSIICLMLSIKLNKPKVNKTMSIVWENVLKKFKH